MAGYDELSKIYRLDHQTKQLFENQKMWQEVQFSESMIV